MIKLNKIARTNMMSYVVTNMTSAGYLTLLTGPMGGGNLGSYINGGNMLGQAYLSMNSGGAFEAVNGIYRFRTGSQFPITLTTGGAPTWFAVFSSSATTAYQLFSGTLTTDPAESAPLLIDSASAQAGQTITCLNLSFGFNIS